MPVKWDVLESPPVNVGQQLPASYQIHSVRAKKHVTVFPRITTAEGAGRGIIKQVFGECAKETRNEPDRVARNELISDCMEKHKKDLGIPGLRVRESRGNFTETVNGRPGLKGKYWAGGKDGKLIDKVDARLIRAGLPTFDFPSELTRGEEELRLNTETQPIKALAGHDVNPEVENLLCEFNQPLTQYLSLMENRQFTDADALVKEMKGLSDCEVCQAIIGEIVRDGTAFKECAGDCASPLEQLRATVKWAKESFCPEGTHIEKD